jgi:hypothetical protein
MTRPTFCRCGLQLFAGHCPDEHSITHNERTER